MVTSALDQNIGGRKRIVWDNGKLYRESMQEYFFKTLHTVSSALDQNTHAVRFVDLFSTKLLISM